MNQVSRWLVPVAVFGLLAMGCSQQSASKPVQPKRSLDELYALAATVNSDADPYLLGSGDGLGQRTFDIYVEEVVMDHPKP